MIITPIDRLIQMIRDYFGEREDYKLSIKKNRLAYYITVEIIMAVLLLLPIVWVFKRYYANGIESVSGRIFVVGVAYLIFALVLSKIPNKSKIKLRGWLGGKGKFWKWS